MHKIDIPAYALDLAGSRGRRTAGLSDINPTRSALLVVDMQNAFVRPDGALAIRYAREIVTAINRIAGHLRASGGKVVWIQTDFSDERDNWSVWFCQRLTPDASRTMIGCLSPGHDGFELFDELDVRDADIRCVKKRFSPFARGASSLEAQLARRGIDTVMVTGTVSNTCCESTARDAMMLNYRTVFVTDANAARTDAEHNATLANMLQTFAEVASTDELISAINASRDRPR